MYGIPEDLDLAPFVGTSLDYIGLGIGTLQFVFSGNPYEKDRVITVEGCWELRDKDSGLIDKAIEPDERDVYRVHKVLSRRVTETKLKPQTSFSLIFDNGWILTIVDDSCQYETCHIFVGDREIHI
jgi:hypothetical protein